MDWLSIPDDGTYEPTPRTSKAFNREITALLITGPDQLPCLVLPNDAQIYAYVMPAKDSLGGKPHLQISVHLDGDWWPPELVDDDGSVRLQVTVGDTDLL